MSYVLLVAAIFAGGIVLLHLIPHQRVRLRWLVAGLLLVIITPLVLIGFWYSPDTLGLSDWDYYFSLHHSWRQIILDFKQLPTWNPWTCGGTAGLGDPEFSVFTPTFGLELLFGEAAGLRLAIFLSVIVGSLGMLTLAKRLRLSPQGGLVAALGVWFGSVNLLEIVEGHVNIFSAMWIPWIFWALISAYWTPSHRRWKYTVLLAVFLAATFYQGGIYLLMYTALAFLILPWLTRHPLQMLRIMVVSGLLALGLAAFKMIPVLAWLKDFPDKVYANTTYTLPYLYDILLARHLHGTQVIPNQGTGWHEYGAYIGPFIVGLALVGASKGRRSRLVRGLVIAALLALLLSSSGPLLKPLFDHVPFIPRSAIARVILFAVIPLSLLAGIGLDAVRRWSRSGLLLGAVLVALAGLDLFGVAYALSLQAFVLPDVVRSLPHSPYPLAFTVKTFLTRYHGDDHTRAYAAVRAGYGALNYCSVLGPNAGVKPIEDELGGPYLIFEHPTSHGRLLAWSPRSATVEATAVEPDTISLNTNYARGWKVNGQPARNIAGRVGTALQPGTVTLKFTYHAPGFVTGAVISLLTLLFVGTLSITRQWRRFGHSSR